MKHLIATIVGIVLGGIISAINYFVALSNVKVRPELEKVSFLDALLSSHAHHWLFFHYPIVMSTFVIVFLVLLFNLIISVNERKF